MLGADTSSIILGMIGLTLTATSRAFAGRDGSVGGARDCQETPGVSYSSDSHPTGL